MILRQPAIITECHTATVTSVGYPRQFPPAISTEFVVGLLIVVMMPGAVVIFGQVMIRAESVPAPPACIGEFVKDFPAIVATVH